MRRGRLRAKAAVAVCTAGALAAVWSCRDPTEVTLVITTDVSCDTILGTGDASGNGPMGVKIVVGTSGADLDAKSMEPVADTTNQCIPGPVPPPGSFTENDIGTFVVIPNQGGGSSESVAVMVVVGVTRPANDCNFGNAYQGCITARRELSFVPHTPLTLPIAVDHYCLNIQCDMADQTCMRGKCGSDLIGNPGGSCTGSGGGCVPPPGDASGFLADDGPNEATSSEDAGPDHEVVDGTTDQGADVVSSIDSPEDVTVDTPPDQGVSQPEPPGPDAPSSDAPIDMTVDAPPDVTVDAPGPGMDAKPDVGGGVDATMDAPPETSPPIDAPADIASPPDASEASPPPSEGGLADDGGLGSCVTAGTFSGVECNGSTCVTGDVCCIDHDPIGMTLFETCTPPSGCTAGINSFGHQISSYACRNRGDCATGNVCCAGTAPSAGLVLSCVAAGSCAGAFTQTLACRNTCECTTGTCKGVVGGCYGESVATCSGTCP